MILNTFKLFFCVLLLTLIHFSTDAKPAITETEMVVDEARIKNSFNTNERSLKFKKQEDISKQLPFDAVKWVNIRIRVG